MRSLERVFRKIQNENPDLSTFICFALAVEGKSFKRKTIRKHLNALIDKEDYDLSEKKRLIDHLYFLSSNSKN